MLCGGRSRGCVRRSSCRNPMHSLCKVRPLSKGTTESTISPLWRTRTIIWGSRSQRWSALSVSLIRSFSMFHSKNSSQRASTTSLKLRHRENFSNFIFRWRKPNKNWIFFTLRWGNVVSKYPLNSTLLNLPTVFLLTQAKSKEFNLKLTSSKLSVS